MCFLPLHDDLWLQLQLQVFWVCYHLLCTSFHHTAFSTKMKKFLLWSPLTFTCFLCLWQNEYCFFWFCLFKNDFLVALPEKLDLLIVWAIASRLTQWSTRAVDVSSSPITEGLMVVSLINVFQSVYMDGYVSVGLHFLNEFSLTNFWGLHRAAALRDCVLIRWLLKAIGCTFSRGWMQHPWDFYFHKCLKTTLFFIHL